MDLRTRIRQAAYVGVNIWLVFHLFTICVTPATIGPASPTSLYASKVVTPYLQPLYLNHGFHYFAPEPGSSSLLEYELTMADGSTRSGTLPNGDIRPRLLYHRHFMLTEYLGGTEPEYRGPLIEAFAQQLMRQSEAQFVSMTLVTHNLPTMTRVRVGGMLTEDDLYERESLGTYQWRDSLTE